MISKGYGPTCQPEMLVWLCLSGFGGAVTVPRKPVGSGCVVPIQA